MLTSKQIAFCKEVAKGKSGTEAYQIAYKSNSSGTCKVNASRMLKSPEIREQISKFQSTVKTIIDQATKKELEDNVHFEVASVAERMHILTQIIRGKLKVSKTAIGEAGIINYDEGPDFFDRINAMKELNKMDGSYVPIEKKVEKSVRIRITKK